LANYDLLASFQVVDPLSSDCQDVLLDRQLNRIRRDAGEVKVDVEYLAPAIRIHRKATRHAPGRPTQQLLTYPLELAKRVVTQHRHSSALHRRHYASIFTSRSPPSASSQ